MWLKNVGFFSQKTEFFEKEIYFIFLLAQFNTITKQ